MQMDSTPVEYDPSLSVFEALFKDSNLAGFVDGVGGRTLRGWAADRSDFSRRLVIDVFHGEKLVAGAVADQFREDLSRAGLGDGKYAFQCIIPRSDASAGSLTVNVRIKGTNFRMTHRGEGNIQVDVSGFLSYIAADIVDNCNLRCPFCLVDYGAVLGTKLMREDTFQRLLLLLDSVPEEGFWLSCLHEPTLHPQLNRFLQLIPPNQRKKVWFTTNLARPLSAETFEEWARSGIHHINISLDSMDPERFARLREFGRYEVFKANLDLLAKVFSRCNDRPELRYITMAFKSNMDEIPRIVQHANTHWGASEHEIRYTYNVGHITDEFRRREYLDPEDWDSLETALQPLRGQFGIAYPPADGYEELIQPSANFENSPEVSLGDLEPYLSRPFALRARPDGTLLVVDHEKEAAVNIHSLADPVQFFTNV